MAWPGGAEGRDGPPYYGMEALIALMDEPIRAKCVRILEDNRALFLLAPGSTHNHQAWAGGYWDHVVEAMNLWVLLYRSLEQTGRWEEMVEGERFSLADGLVVLFLHDIEKPWRWLPVEGQPAWDEKGQLLTRPEYRNKAARTALAAAKIAEYEIGLSPMQANALRYVEGLRDDEYSPEQRVMSPLAALCHSCDLLSARLFYNFPARGIRLPGKDGESRD